METGEKLILYTGIGAKDTPPAMLAIIEKLAAYMARQGYVLRSGAAEGASTGFEKGCVEANGKKAIYLPWRGFNGNNSTLYNLPERALSIVKDFNPAWSTLSESGKKLQARYALALLGPELTTPSMCVICYTAGGKQKGGTGQALKIAKNHNIPIFDLGEYETTPDILKSKLIEFLSGLSLNTNGLEI